MGGLVILVLVAAGAAHAILGGKTSYQTAAQDFINAVQTKNKAAADQLESSAAKTSFQKTDGTTSFYSSCQQNGILCTMYFQSAFLSKASKTYQSYSAANGTKGEEMIYSLKQSVKGTDSTGKACTINSTTTLTIGLVPNGKSWRVDYINQEVGGLDNNLCLSTSSSPSTQTTTSSTPSQASAPLQPVSGAANDNQAKIQGNSIQSLLESYWANYGYYPSDLSPSPLINQPGVTGAIPSEFVAPTGTQFTYTPSPGGCTTANQQCQQYTLVVSETGGTVIATIKSLN